LTVKLPSPFRDSRTLSAGDPLLGEAGVALDLAGLEFDEALRESWRNRVERIAQRLGWPRPRFAEMRRGDRVTLAFTAPAGRLTAALAANEWALCAALVARDPSHWRAIAADIDEAAMLQMLGTLAETSD
jgi:hypothetical protein